MIAAACGQDNKHTSEASFPVRQQCFALVNGTATMEDVGVALVLTNTGSMCSGTFIAHNALLTAAHCVPADGRVIVIVDDCANSRSVPVYASRVFHGGLTAEDFGETIQTTDQAERDAAVALLPDQTAPAVIGLSARAPTDADTLTMVGLGADVPGNELLDEDYRGMEAAVKRRGTTKVVAGAEDDPILTAVVTDANAAFLSKGDSGGPLLLEGKVAGVASFATDGRPGEGSSVLGGWVNIHGVQVQGLIHAAIAGGAAIDKP